MINDGGVLTSFTVSPSMTSAGLTLHTNSLSAVYFDGTPVVAGSYSYTFSGSNTGLQPRNYFFFIALFFTGGSFSSTISVSITVQPPTRLTYLSNTLSYYRGNAITINTATSEGGTPTSFTSSPLLSDIGLVLSSTTGAISGTPTVLVTSSAYTITASNSGGSVTAVLTITVADLACSPVYSSSSLSFTLDRAISIVSVTSLGCQADLFSISPALPTGLSFNTATGSISGNLLLESP